MSRGKSGLLPGVSWISPGRPYPLNRAHNPKVRVQIRSLAMMCVGWRRSGADTILVARVAALLEGDAEFLVNGPAEVPSPFRQLLAKFCILLARGQLPGRESPLGVEGRRVLDDLDEPFPPLNPLPP